MSDGANIGSALKKGVALNFLGIVARALRPVFLIIFSRSLGVEGFGLYMLAFAVFEVGDKLGVLGLNWGVVRIIGELRGRNQEAAVRPTLFRIAALCFLSSSSVAAVIFLAAPWISNVLLTQPELLEPLRIFCFAIPLVSLGTTLLYSLRPSLNMKYEVFSRSFLEALLILIFGVLLLNKGMGVSGVVWAHVISAFIVLMLSVFFVLRTYRRTNASGNLAPEIVPWSDLLKASFGMGGMEFLTQSKFRLDLFVLGRMLSLQDVGVYAAMVEVVGLIRKVKAAFVPILQPLSHRLRLHEDPSLMENQIARALQWSFVPSLGLMGTMMLVPEAYLNAFGQKFTIEGAVFSLIVLAFGQFVYVNVGLLEAVMAIIGHSIRTFSNMLVAFTINLILLLVAVPIWGIEGAAVSTTLSFLFLALLLDHQSYQILGFRYLRRSLARPMLAFLGSFLIAFLIRPLFGEDNYLHWTSHATLYLVLYATFILLMKRMKNGSRKNRNEEMSLNQNSLTDIA